MNARDRFTGETRATTTGVIVTSRAGFQLR